MFVDAYLPFAENGSGAVLYVDTRGGEQQGCVRDVGWEGADEADPISKSLTDYVNSVRISIASGTEHSGMLPAVEEWRTDLGSRLQRQTAHCGHLSLSRL
jgi:hypothetical protein